MTNGKPEKPVTFVSVVIPCWNEKKNIEGGALGEVQEYLSRQSYEWEVIIINDGSTDGSRELLQRFIEGRKNFSLHDIPHQGKQAGLWEGIQKARGNVVLFTDMDQSTPVSELGKLLPWHEQGFDVVIGSRGHAREGSSFLRKVGSLVFLTLRRFVLLRDITDTQCGFKLCRRQVALEIFPRLRCHDKHARHSGWKVSAYDVEFLHLCEKAGYRIREVEVSWCNRDRSDTKGAEGELARYMRESIDMARVVTRVKLNDMKGLYDR